MVRWQETHPKFMCSRRWIEVMIFVLSAENSGGIKIGAKGEEAAVWARGGDGKAG